MRQEAVVLSYLEWTRLIGVGAIRLDEKRIFRWRPDRTDPTQVVASLMMSAPDLGTSATSFVLAMLEPEVLDQIQEGGTYLGQRLNIDAVRSFHSFSETALAIHKHDAEVAGAAIALTPLAEGWAPWAAAVDAADRRARGEALLAILEVPPCDRFSDATDRLIARESCIAPDDIARARDSMFFGWACVLNALKMSSGAAPVLPVDVKEEAEALRRNFDVEQPFLARAPRLCAFVAGLAAEGDRPTDLLAMASLKQHERYVIKREGTALDVPSLVDDIRVLEELQIGAAGLLIQTLGERLPNELIQALKVQGVTRSIAPNGVHTSAADITVGAPDPDSFSKTSCICAVTKTRQVADAAIGSSVNVQSSLTPKPRDRECGTPPINQAAENLADCDASLDSEVRNQEDVTSKTKSNNRSRKYSQKNKNKTKVQTELFVTSDEAATKLLAPDDLQCDIGCVLCPAEDSLDEGKGAP